MATTVGRIGEIWRYPVKSLAGECIAKAQIDELGVIGDRTWAFIDADSGDVAWGKSSPRLMNLVARYRDEHPQERVFGDLVPAVAVDLTDGTRRDSDDAELNPLVSAYIDRRVEISPLRPPAEREHYRWSQPLDEKKLRAILGLAVDDALPDLSTYDGELMATLGECFSPPGAYHDCYPVHLLSSATLSHMQEIGGESFDRKRFRPNLYLEAASGVEGLAEFAWLGRRLQVGGAEFRVAVKTVRCSMPAREQRPFGLDQDPAVAKALHQATDRFLGVYLSVIRQGEVAVGDEAVLLD